MQPTTGLSRYMLGAVETIRLVIDLHPLDQKGMDFFTDMAQVSRKTLQKAFKFNYGCTIIEYQQKKRMDAAAEMILEGRLTQKQIARKCGYHKDNNFSRAFKRVYKQTPRQYGCTTQLDIHDTKKT
jgi:AraC-like DNA-binding protein